LDSIQYQLGSIQNMESGKNVSNVVRVSVGVVTKVLPGVDRWKAELAKLQLKAEEADRHLMQQQIMFETSFSGSEGEVISPFGGRNVVQRSIAEELRFSYANSDEDSDVSDSLSSVSDLSDCAEIQQALDEEMSFSSDGSQDLSGVSFSDEKPNPQDLSCDRCWRFFHAEYVRARSRKSLLALVMAGSPQLVLGDTALAFVR
jgi:hypothetical protein